MTLSSIQDQRQHASEKLLLGNKAIVNVLFVGSGINLVGNCWKQDARIFNCILKWKTTLYVSVCLLIKAKPWKVAESLLALSGI